MYAVGDVVLYAHTQGYSNVLITHLYGKTGMGLEVDPNMYDLSDEPVLIQTDRIKNLVISRT